MRRSKTGQESSSSLPTPESPDSWDTVVLVGEELRREAGDEAPEDDGEGEVGGEDEDEDELGGENLRVFFEALVRPKEGKARVAISPSCSRT